MLEPKQQEGVCQWYGCLLDHACVCVCFLPHSVYLYVSLPACVCLCKCVFLCDSGWVMGPVQRITWRTDAGFLSPRAMARCVYNQTCVDRRDGHHTVMMTSTCCRWHPAKHTHRTNDFFPKLIVLAQKKTYTYFRVEAVQHFLRYCFIHLMY